MKIGMISPIAWRTPPLHYGPWESVVSLITEGLVVRGHDVTLFATGDSVTSAKLNFVVAKGYEEDKSYNVKVWEALHIANVFERAGEFDIIHNHFDFLPLSYSRLVDTPLVTTIHGFSSKKILPMYQKYNKNTYYVSISKSDRCDDLEYIDNIYHGIDLDKFEFNPKGDDYLLFFGRIHPDKGCSDAIKIAKRLKMKLIIAGIIHDSDYFYHKVKPYIDNYMIQYVGSVGPKKRNKLLGGARALLHPIYFDEPFGLSVVEAMACGTPVIAYRKGSMPELIENRKNGYLVDNLEEALEAVLKISYLDRFECRKIVEERFTQDIMVDNYIRTYEKILKI